MVEIINIEFSTWLKAVVLTCSVILLSLVIMSIIWVQKYRKRILIETKEESPEENDLEKTTESLQILENRAS